MKESGEIIYHMGKDYKNTLMGNHIKETIKMVLKKEKVILNGL